MVKSSGGKIYLNVGSEGGVSYGDKFRIFSVGEELVDPEVGMTLGAEGGNRKIILAFGASEAKSTEGTARCQSRQSANDYRRGQVSR